MRKQSPWPMIAVVTLIVIAAAWAGSGPLWRWLLALHGIHD